MPELLSIPEPSGKNRGQPPQWGGPGGADERNQYGRLSTSSADGLLRGWEGPLSYSADKGSSIRGFAANVESFGDAVWFNRVIYV